MKEILGRVLYVVLGLLCGPIAIVRFLISSFIVLCSLPYLIMNRNLFLDIFEQWVDDVCKMWVLFIFFTVFLHRDKPVGLRVIALVKYKFDMLFLPEDKCKEHLLNNKYYPLFAWWGEK